jgi:hypothetical protein
VGIAEFQIYDFRFAIAGCAKYITVWRGGGNEKARKGCALDGFFLAFYFLRR